ncbi:hypothetical protein COR50_13630 [Chitinophaga caeni]|uniref:RagB/SusD family nutrient uptake outer membrane protein n=1 Tax=Chitinophaga caeni TaxID=2029983 RepID=A0A291QVX1_9BACT|nr:RagB/SusD family nutrient uptake outer membrane protein [Chitinophaga caeni]ATL48118.1 hypothetical protein COR50_13630 [Chitinophaga caeni]
MKINHRIILVFAYILLGSSCSKDFLNEIKPENGDVTEDVVFSSKEGAESAITGMLDIFREENYNGYPNTGNLTNRGLQTTMFLFEVRANDVFDAYYSWWRAEGSWEESGYGRIQTGTRTKQIWDMFYKVINNANVIIKRVPDLTDVAPEQKEAFIAEAKAARAYAYFWLARVYQFTYAKDPQAKAIPIYMEPTTSATIGNPRSTLQEVYDLILEDLLYAVDKLPTDRTGKFRINKNVASGILAEVYQELAPGNAAYWEKVSTYAHAAREGFPLTSNAEYNSGFNSVSNSGWIWAFPVPDEQSLSYYSQFSYMDPYYGYYRNIAINTSFVNLFSATDIRKSRFLYWGDVAGYPALVYQTTKYTSRSTSAIQGDILLMRSAEMLLAEAEALAQQDELQGAIDLLFELQGLRDPNATKLAANTPKQDIIDAILLERRKELYAENGMSYFDLKRYQKDLVRNGNHPYPITVPNDDKRWVFQIPLAEIDANPNINPGDQNP